MILQENIVYFLFMLNLLHCASKDLCMLIMVIIFQEMMENIKIQIQKFLHELSIIPAALIVACIPTLRKRERKKFREISKEIASVLPKNCPFIFGVDKVNDCRLLGENSYGLPEEIENDRRLKISLLVIPKVKDVSVGKIFLKTENSEPENTYSCSSGIRREDTKFVFLVAKSEEKDCVQIIHQVSGADLQ